MIPVEPLLPLKPAPLHLLLAVAGGHCHAYAIRKEVERQTGGRLRLWPTTLYRTVAALIEHGLLEEDSEAPPADGDRARRLYRLTPRGRQVLGDEIARLGALLQHARGLEVLLGSDGGEP
jgi:DNA-binding PadR family transcriptional regulator